MPEFPRVLPFGDRALLLEFEDVLSPEVNGRVRALARRLADVPGVIETVPAFRSVLAVLDPRAGSQDTAARTALELARSIPAVPSGTARVLDVPVVYGGDSGPDLPAVAGATGLSPDEIVFIHGSHEYLVYMLGFAPGFPYLGTVDERLRVPRLDVPRLRVPAGSVAVADWLTGIYPSQTAGGWRLIGRTPLRTYDPADPDPFLFQPGDRVRFVPIPHTEFEGDLGLARPMRAAARPVLEVLEPGLYTTVQDAGRPGYRSRGLPASGAMDLLALRTANAAVGNDPNAAVLELTIPGPVLRALDQVTIAVAGADLPASVDGTPVSPGEPTPMARGQTLELRGQTPQFGLPRRGVWAYLALEGGVDVPRPLGSAATYVPGRLGGLAGRRLIAGDVLGRRSDPRGRPAGSPPAVALPGDEVAIRFVPGPQVDWFTGDAMGVLTSSPYQVTVHVDRAGTRLVGPALRHRGRADILSDGMLPGAIQVPGSGQPIVIMADGPTTGGYPKIGVVVSEDLRLLAQARPGTQIRFVEVSLSSLRGA